MEADVRTILFFDDWPIQSHRGIDRKWFAAEPWPGHEPWHDASLAYSSVSSVLRDPDTGAWRLYGGVMTDTSRSDEGVGLGLYTSADGIDWQPHRLDRPIDKNATPAATHILFSGEYACGGAPFYDPRDPDPARRYKLPYSDLSPRPVAPEGTCRMAFSADGIHWTMDKTAVWRDQHTDTLFSSAWNPYTGKYQFTGRPILGDRRVALYQTVDWRAFEQPVVIVHPDPMDPPCVEFYGMPHFFYEGYFVGFLWKQHGAFGDETYAARMKGRVDSELTYSVNGTHWNRTSRAPFLPDRGIGRGGFGNEYPSAMIQDDDGWLRVYTTSCIGEHADGGKFQPGEPIAHVTISRWRRDGFCALESHSDAGHVTLRALISRGGEITLNATTGRFGKIRAELRMVPDKRPIPGYELENSIPVSGDGHSLKLCWKERETIDGFAGEPFRIFLELDQARLYAVRVNADSLYGFVPQTNLAGDYIPDQLPGMQFNRDAAYGFAST
jgi:hypothetical protein